MVFWSLQQSLVPRGLAGSRKLSAWHQIKTFFGRFQEATLQFVLTCQQATDIASNRDISQGSKMEYPYQVIF